MIGSIQGIVTQGWFHSTWSLITEEWSRSLRCLLMCVLPLGCTPRWGNHGRRNNGPTHPPPRRKEPWENCQRFSTLKRRVGQNIALHALLRCARCICLSTTVLLPRLIQPHFFKASIFKCGWGYRPDNR